MRKLRPYGPRFRRKRFLRHLIAPRRRRQLGYSLVDVMVSSIVIGIVIFLAWTGLISSLNYSNAAQARTARSNELIRAQDIMLNEIREANSVNQSGALQANGTTISVADVVANSGVSLSDLGNYGDIALYLELPLNSSVASCPDNTGVIPDSIERIVYDIRTSPDGWLEPQAIVRYGRIPSLNGTIDPCSKPVANDVIADAIADKPSDATCKGILGGRAGFRTCWEGDSLKLLMKSSISEIESLSTESRVTTRSVTLNPIDEMAKTLKSFREAFESYRKETGQFPNESHLVLPSEMEDFISSQIWGAPTPLGGNYDWEGPNVYPFAGISLDGVTASSGVLIELDKRLDDGDLNAGNFQLSSNGRYTWIFEGYQMSMF